MDNFAARRLWSVRCNSNLWQQPRALRLFKWKSGALHRGVAACGRREALGDFGGDRIGFGAQGFRFASTWRAMGDASKVEEVAKEAEAFVRKQEEVEYARLPLKFEDEREEVNFFALKALLDFGRGYEDVLVAEGNRAIDETLPFGLMHMHICGESLDAEHLTNMNHFAITQHFSLKGVTFEEEVMPGMYKDTPGPLMPLAALYVKVLTETGQKLVELGKESLGSYLMEKLTAGTTAAQLVEDLAETFPAFKDHADGLPVNRKATILVRDIRDTFKDRPESPLCGVLSDADSLPVSVGSDLVTALRCAKLLEDGPTTLVLENSEEDRKVEGTLRASSLHIATQLADMAKLSPKQIETFLTTKYATGEVIKDENRLLVRGSIHY